VVLRSHFRYLNVEYLIADLLQRSPRPDREATLRHALAEYEKYLMRLDEYGLLSSGDKKLYERYLENPTAFTIASLTDTAARRELKVARFREEKELKQKLEVRYPSLVKIARGPR
jgi:immunoglobulin-binding protein 1